MRSFYTLLVVFLSILSPVMGDVSIETLQGREIAPHTQEIVQFINKIYREYPYFYNGDDAGYTSYLECYPNVDDAIVSLARDGKEIVGIAIGLPMPKRDVYQETLLQHGYNLGNLFYLGEFGLKPTYHGQGIERALYQNVENFAKKCGQFTSMCMWEIAGNALEKTQSFFPGDDFWKQLGFVRHPELNFEIYWTNIGAAEETPHKAIYWLKCL